MLCISMAGQGADEELRSLRAWILESPKVRRHAKIRWKISPPQEHQMGVGALDALQLITENLWQIANFSLSYIAWRKTRNRSPQVTIEYNGKSVKIEGSDTEAIERIIRSLGEE
ncbi:effector-associated constant component EACC1 [Streptomyces sp. NPDC004673]